MDKETLVRFVSDGFDKAKKGDAINVYKSVLPFFADTTLPVKSHYPFAWIIYYALHQSPDNEILSRKKMLANYFKLSLSTPHKLHSMILTEAIRLYRDCKNMAYNNQGKDVSAFSIVRFMDLWNFDNLRPGDWKRKEYEGKLLSSTAEKLITVYVDELETTRTAPSQRFNEIVDFAIASFPGAFNLLAQRAVLHQLTNEPDKAASLLRSAILLAPNKFYLWQKLAGLIDVVRNPHLHVALLYKALLAPGPEQFKGRIRLGLASALASRGAFAQALWEIDRVQSVYVNNGWHIPRILNELRGRIPAGAVAANPEAIYRKVEHLADMEIYSSLSQRKMHKTYHKVVTPESVMGKGKQSVAWRMTDENGDNYWFNPERMHIDPNLPLGTELHIRLYSNKIVSAELIPVPHTFTASEPEVMYGDPDPGREDNQPILEESVIDMFDTSIPIDIEEFENQLMLKYDWI